MVLWNMWSWTVHDKRQELFQWISQEIDLKKKHSEVPVVSVWNHQNFVKDCNFLSFVINMIICMVLRLVFRKKCKVFSLISFLCPQRVKHFTFTMCIRIATQYEKSWQNNRIYLQVYPHVHTKLYTGRFSRKVQYFFGSDSSGHWKKNFCVICISSDLITVTCSHGLGKNQEKERNFPKGWTH